MYSLSLFILTFTSLNTLTFASAIPAMPAELVQSSVSSVANSTALSPFNAAASIESRCYWHRQPFCTPTGSGICNFALYQFAGDGIFAPVHTSLYIYNRYCCLIGNSDSVSGNFNLDSQLPFVVVGNTIENSFCYAGKCYNRGNCIEYNREDTCTGVVTQCAFDCDQGGWDDGSNCEAG